MTAVITATRHHHLIGGNWQAGQGAAFYSTDPSTGDRVWEGCAAPASEVTAAVGAARTAFGPWADLPLSERVKYVETFAEQLRSHKDEMAEAIGRETGKPRWESLEEVQSMIGKVVLSIQAYQDRRGEKTEDIAGARAATRYRPIGVMAVFGPFNFPGHLPNGHIVPALLAGNTVVFKPSELAPLVAERTVELWQAAGLPPGVMNLVQGGRETGQALAAQPGIDGVLFTGSFLAGQWLHRQLAGQPQRILALEMGGNNPLIVWDVADLDAAALMTIQSAYITAGQRCSCARRLIVPADAAGDRFVERLAAMVTRIRVGAWNADPEPFMGPVISSAAADQLLNAQEDLRQRGGEEIVPMTRAGGSPAMLSPGLMNVTSVAAREDTEYFGPFLQVIHVANFDAAIREANDTAYGLAAGLLSDSREKFEQFYGKSRAGILNWNRPTTGASGRLPFGGTGNSGNHRPSGYFAADYCSYPVASLEAAKLEMPAKWPVGIAR
jgi:succinylglutamic semialdehyde dehydrogenase